MYVPFSYICSPTGFFIIIIILTVLVCICEEIVTLIQRLYIRTLHLSGIISEFHFVTMSVMLIFRTILFALKG
jgi:hypothetical protein